MEMSKQKHADFLKLTDSAEVLYLRKSEIIMVCKVENFESGHETVITLRNGKAFQVLSTVEEVMQYLDPEKIPYDIEVFA